MNKISRTWIAAIAGLAMISLQGLAFAAGAPAAAPAKAPAAAPAKATAQGPKLLNDDCAKCHAKAPADIAANGAKHKTVIGCQDCHNGHPPTVKNIIPKCSQCHDGKPHYKLANCAGCHSNPHSPLIIKMGRNVTDPCLTCHTQQIVKLRENKSKHTALACSFCHDTHGKIPACTQCHKPHTKEQVNADCKKCHQAHMPTAVTYSNQTPSKDCGACHKAALQLLSASPFKHKNLSCVACHQAKHKMIPQCQSCHGTPHPATMLSKFPKCGYCHGIAHDLNSFKGQGDPAAADLAPAAKAKKKK
jgi:hypothetical protein